jgi:gas vesicle protein
MEINNEVNKMNMKWLTYGILFGGAVGAITALFSAPSSGEELRKQIREQKDEWCRWLQELNIHLHNLQTSVQHTTKEGKEVLSELITDLKQSFHQWRHEMKPHENLLKQEIAEIHKALTELEQKLNHYE